MAEVKGIDSMLAILDGLEVLIDFGKKVSADGKVDLNDLNALVDLAGKSDQLVKAIKSASDVKDEVKDLTLAEVQTIVSKIYEVVAKAKA